DVLSTGDITHDRIADIADTFREVAREQVSLCGRPQITTEDRRHLKMRGLPDVLEEALEDSGRGHLTEPSRVSLVMRIPVRMQGQRRPPEALQHRHCGVVANYAVQDGALDAQDIHRS